MKQRKKYQSQRTRSFTALIFLLIASLPYPTLTQDVESNEIDQTSNDIVNPDEYRKNDQYHYLSTSSGQPTDIPETVITGEKVLRINESPYQLRTDLVVERGAKLMVEPGVVVYFAPMVGITVKGVVKAIGTANKKITFTSQPNSGYPDLSTIEHTEAGARLVDGPSPVEGRLQIYHHGKWRSVCSNSRNWTIPDYETVCRQMGYKGGRFWNWMERTFNYDPRLLYEDPGCGGDERNLFECRNWRSRQLGSGVCDYHADIGIQCQPLLQGTSSHWAGLSFDFAQAGEQLSNGDTLFESLSLSELEHVEIIRAGAGRNRKVTAGIQVQGVPPQLRHILVDHSAYNGINVTKHDAAFTFKDVQVRRSKGYGIFVNSSYGLAHLEDCKIHENGADGVRYVGHDLRADERRDRNKILDFCTLPRTSNQIYPIHLSILQSAFAVTSKECEQLFSTKIGYTLTFSFNYFMVKRNESAWIEVFDGSTVNDRLLGKWYVRNDTRPQSLSSNREKLLVRFHGDARSEIHAYFKVTAGIFKAYDLNVTSTVIEDNGGRGIAIDNIRSAVHVHSTSISNNNHIAGLHVVNGAGDINVTDSHIQFNQGDGINITYYGGNRNVSRSFLSNNQGYGMAVWLNETAKDRQEFVSFNQTSVLEYSEIVRNLETGLYHGNYSKTHYVNVTGNYFNDSLNDGVEILSGWFEQEPGQRLKLQIGHNTFRSGHKIGVKLSPALNLDARIEYNIFENGKHGQLLIRNKQLEEFRMLPVDILVLNNYFLRNQGRYVVSLGLSAYSDRKDQQIIFFKNFVRDNKITEPFTMIEEAGEGMSGEGRLSPRSRVAAPIVITTNNVDVFRNIISNPDSKYEVGSQFSDQSAVLNVTYNYLGTSDEEKVYRRIFHRKDRYNLAKIEYIPYLLHNSNPMTPQVFQYPMYVPRFYSEGTEKVGGEVDGQEELPPGTYTVDRDISIRPGGKLILKPGVTLNFAPSVGMMVAGKLEARGRSPDDIMFTLKREPIMMNETEHEMDALKMDPEFNVDTETEHIEAPTTVRETPTVFTPVRLVGGQTEHEGRLQVHIDGRWGTVCDYNWDIVNAALVCHQLGLALNPKDWRLERSEVPSAGLDEDVILSNVRCTEHDNDITKCRAEHVSKNQFENSCSHDTDVGVRCYEGAWAGLRFGVVAEQADLQYVTVERAGLFDYVTNTFKPAIQFDFARHNLDNVRVVENLHDGLGVIYSDIYSGGINNIRNSEFSKNKGNGISLKQLGLQVKHSIIKENAAAGIHHDPVLSALEQRELAGWFLVSPDSSDLDTDYKPIVLPRDNQNIDVDQWKAKYLVTEKTRDNVEVTINARCQPGYVIGMQLLNPIENRSSEEIFIYDSQTGNLKSDIWLVKRDISTFPITSSSYGIVIKYKSGVNALGGVVLVLNAIQAPAQTIYNRIVRGPIPTLTVTSSKIQKNFRGLTAMYYNRYLGDEGEHYLRKANESIKLINCEITQNLGEAFYINSPFWDVHESNISEIHIHINNTRVVDNGRGVRQFSKDLRSSNNLFHYVMQDTTFERNGLGGLELSLPFVWQYNENFTHSIYLGNDTWAQNRRFGILIEGHYAEVNITGNRFIENDCLNGLVGFKGMEKKFRIDFNKFQRNNGKYMVEFKTDSQSEILGSVFALFAYNELENNTYNEREMFKPTFRAAMRAYHQKLKHPTCVIGFGGVQKVQIYRNLFRSNGQEYDLVAGVHSARLNNELLATENWWGSRDPLYIRTRIFDFEDWNNHAEVKWRPFLLENDIEGSQSSSVADKIPVDLTNVGGKITEDLVLFQRDIPYIINSDITIMPKVTLTIHGGVEMRFAPNVGILVLGTLVARGIDGGEILMHPTEKLPQSLQSRELSHERSRRGLESQEMHDGIRLCKDGNCTAIVDGLKHHEGFLEFFNRTTLQWVPVCDRRFTERNAQVVCRELGFDPLDTFYGHDTRLEFHINSLSRIWSWLEPLECDGDENRLSDCPERLNGQVYGRRHECKWDDVFVFVSCHGEGDTKSYWGGIRFANPEFEQNLYEHRIHDTHTHDTMKKEESFLEYVRIVRAGILHGEKSAGVQTINKNPNIRSVSIIDSAHHGINLVSPSDTIHLQHLNIRNSFGQGINAISLTGEGRESDESSFSPLKDLDLPYSLFSLIDICDTTKEITIEERVLVYYKYDNNPVNCVKIFNSAFRVKPLGFRLLQSNLFNHSKEYGRRDQILLYDGDIYNVSSIKIGQVEADLDNDRRLFKTREPTMSIRLIASGAPARHGFIAEVVTLPISGILFNRDAQHNISNSEIINNVGGAIEYVSVGEVTPILTLERNRIMNNGRQLYGNFSTCDSPISVDVQNMQSLYFRNNLVQNNQGGLFVRADSRGSATSLRGYIHHNLFTRNKNRPSLLIEGRQSSPYQEVTIYKNYFTQNKAGYKDVIGLRQVVSNFTYNYVHSNWGGRIVEISGFDKVRLPIYQTTSHNGFYDNVATDWRGRATVVAGTAGQHYIDNIFYNPDNDYEIITVNKSIFEVQQYWNSTIDLWKTKIDAAHNYWSYNETLAVGSRIRDRIDDPQLLEVQYLPLQMNNLSILDGGKCPPGWSMLIDTCYMYIGAPMTYQEAKDFCRSDNASLPFIRGDTTHLWLYLQRQMAHLRYTERVWIQDLDFINRCTSFVYRSVEFDDCEAKNPFVCEIDPKVFLKPIFWSADIVFISVVVLFGLAILLLLILCFCWYSKTKHRQMQRFERRNSIRQSLRSLNSIDPQGSLRRRNYVVGRSTDTLTKSTVTDYKKMMTEGSIESIEKSVLSSETSLERYDTSNAPYGDYSNTQGYNDILTPKFEQYATQKPDPQPRAKVYGLPVYNEQGFELAYRNEGFKDNSVFGTRNNSVGTQLNDDSTPIMHQTDDSGSDYYGNSSTLPLRNGGENLSFLSELKNRLPEYESLPRPSNSGHSSFLPPPPDPPTPLSDISFHTSRSTPPVVGPKPSNSSPAHKYAVPEIRRPTALQIEPPEIKRPESYYKAMQKMRDSSMVPTMVHERPKTLYESSGEESPTKGAPPPLKGKPNSSSRMSKNVPPPNYSRSKSEALLETNFDDEGFPAHVSGIPGGGTGQLTADNRSFSQPLETAM